MDSLLLPAVAVVVPAIGFILYHLFKTSAEPTPFMPAEDDSDGGLEQMSRGSRVKKRPFHHRNKQKNKEEVSSRPSPEERKARPGATRPTASEPTPQSSTPVVAQPTPKQPPAPKSRGKVAKDVSPATSRARTVSFSEDPPNKTADQETTSAVVKTNDVAATSRPPQRTPVKESPRPATSRSTAESKPAAKPKSQSKTKSKASSASASATPASVSGLSKAIEDANLSPSDAQQLIDQLLMASSTSSEWHSKGSHGRVAETLESVKRTRDELAARLDEMLSSHKTTIDSMKDKRAELTEEMRSVKLQFDAIQRAMGQKSKECGHLASKVKALEEELDNKPAPVTGDVHQFVEENRRLKMELESSKLRIADTVTEMNTVKQNSKAAETSLNNQLQQAKSNAERQLKRARDLEKQLKTDSQQSDEASAAKADSDKLRQQMGTLEAAHSTQMASVEKAKSDELAALKKSHEGAIADLEKSHVEKVSSLESRQSEITAELEKAKATASAAVEKAAEPTAAAGPSADTELVASQAEEIEKLKKEVTSWKADCRKFDERLKTSSEKNAELRESTWRAKDEASLAKKKAQEEMKKTIEGFKARQREDAAAEREQVTKMLCALHPGVDAPTDAKTLPDWVQNYTTKATEHVAQMNAQREEASSGAQSSEEAEQLRATLSSAETDCAEWKARCEEAETVLAQTQMALDKIQSEVEEEDAKHVEKENRLESELNRMEASRTEVKKEVDRLTKELADEQNKSQSIASRLKEEGEKHQMQVNKLRKEVDNSKKTNDDMQKFLQQSSARLESQMKDESEKLRRAQSELASYRAKANEATRNIKASEASSANNQKEAGVLSSKLDQTQKELDAAVAEKAKLESEAAASQLKCTQLDGELQAARRDKEAAVAEKKRLSEDVDEMITRLGTVHTAMSKLEAEKSEISRQLETVLSASSSASTDV